jgi:hypothetical protein
MTVFIEFLGKETDIFILRKYAINTNFVTPLDTVKIIANTNGYYKRYNDTTEVDLLSEKVTIKKGYDYQIFLPAKNRLVSITNILSEARTDTYRESEFSCKKLDIYCFNKIFSCKVDNQLIPFNFNGQYKIFIKN